MKWKFDTKQPKQEFSIKFMRLRSNELYVKRVSIVTFLEYIEMYKNGEIEQ